MRWKRRFVLLRTIKEKGRRADHHCRYDTVSPSYGETTGGERKAWFVENFDSLTLPDIYASEWIGEIRRNVIRDLLQAEAPGRSDKVNHPPGDRGRTGTAEKGDVVGDEREVKGYLLNKYNIFAI